MSPRRPDPELRPALVEIAARLLSEEGPRGLTARRIAAASGSSTMAVYTHFGGMSGVARAVVREGFRRLSAELSAVLPTDDPVADMAALGRAYRHSARTNPHLYGVMFGDTLAGFSLTDADRQHGRYTLGTVAACARRCLAAGRFRAAEPEDIAHRMWVATHGLVTLELGGYLVEPWTADACFERQLVTLMIGSGDAPDRAAASVRASARDRVPQA